MDIEDKKQKIKKLILMLYKPHELTEESSTSTVLQIEELSPDPEITNYIFSKKYEHLTVDEIIEKAFSYQPIILGDQSDATKD